MKKVWIAIAVVVLVGGAFWLLKGRKKENGAEKYRTETVDTGEVAMTVTATGTISAVTTVQVGSQVSGIVSRLYADFNSPVKQGQLLAELDPTPFQATVEQRKADLESAVVQQRNAKINFDRQKRLLDEALIPQSDYDTAKANLDDSAAKVDLAKAALVQAETNLKYAKITSPIDGVVVARQYDVGQTVAASFQAPTLFTIAQDLTKMQVQADVDQSDIGRVKVGQTARFTVDAYPDEEFTGTIKQVRLNATANQNVITYPVIVEVPNPDNKLRPTMTANISIEVARKSDVLRVPNSALRFRPTDQAGQAGQAGGAEARAMQSPQGGLAGAAQQLEAGRAGKAQRGWQTVYTLAAGGKLKAVKLRPGITDGRYTEVLEGEIKAGDKVVVGLATAKAEGSRMFGRGF